MQTGPHCDIDPYIDVHRPFIRFNPGPGEKWAIRYNSPESYHYFCKQVLHELIHVSHGYYRAIYCDAAKELKDPYYFQRQAEKLYDKNKKCLSSD